MNNNTSFREEPVPLITFNSTSQQYQINEEAIEFIKQIPPPIGIISVAGLYRTGKSYLLNRMLLNKSNGFGVGPTVNPCTKGLWIWGTPIKGQTAEGDMINILIIDSEGIGALDEDQTHDTRIFSLAILLSSCFIYNSVGSIDENAIQNLSLVVNLTKHIQIKSNGNDDIDSEDYSIYFPSFFWVIRDFSLQLVDQEGEQISSKEYLEKALCPQKGFSDEVEQKNRIRRLLTTFFKERECITLVRPLVNEENLQKLDKMDLDQLRPEFFEQVMNLRKRILTRMKPKLLNNKQLSGEMYVSLIHSYLAAINNGSVPNIENAWNYLCKDECIKAVNQAYDAYDRTLKELLLPKIPTTIEDMKMAHKTAKENAIEAFRKKAIGEISEEFQRELIKKMKYKFNQMKQHNEKESNNICQGFIQREFASIERKLKLHEYKTFLEYERDLKLFYQFLLEHGPKAVNRHVIFLDFLQKMMNEGASFFIKNLQSDMEIQRNCAQELSRKSEKELKDLKEDMLKERNAMAQKLTGLTKDNTDYQMKEQRYEEFIKELKESKEKLEQELKTQMTKERVETTSTIQVTKQKLAEVEEQAKNLERQLFLKESQFTKEKALLEHKAQHFEKLVEEYSKKEKQLDSSILKEKSELSTQIREGNLKNEKIIKELQSKLSELTEVNQQLQEQKEQTDKNIEQELERFQVKEKQLNEQVYELLNQNEKLKNELSAVITNEEKNLTQQKQELGLNMQSLQGRKEELEEQLKNAHDQIKQLQTSQKKNEAILTQKLSFLESELKETKQQLYDAKKAHETTLKVLEVNNMEVQAKAENKQLLEMKENHLREIKELENENEQKKKKFCEQIETLQRDNNELDLKLKFLQANSEREVCELREQLEGSESQRKKIMDQIHNLEEQTKMSSKEIDEKFVARINDLEKINEELKDKLQIENKEMQAKSEEALSQLKNFYELEKERLESRLAEEREKREKSNSQCIEEYENRLREEQIQYEEEIEQLKEEIREYEIQVTNMAAQYEHEIDLKSKNVESLEKMLREAKDSLNTVQTNFAIQMEQQLSSLNTERAQLSQKIEQLSLDLTRKEKDILTLAQKKEQAEQQLAKKEDQFEILKQELTNEKQQISEKLEEMRKRYQDLSDEYLENKINYEKSIALSTQQNEFFGKKVEELEKQLELSSQRYEDRIKSQKLEWSSELSEKLGRLQEERVALEQKYENLKKSSKENELQTGKSISVLEKEKAIAQEKLTHLEARLADIETKNQVELDNLNQQVCQAKDQLINERRNLQTDVERLKNSCNQLETEKHELWSAYERDKVLWEGKFNFLEQQKEQAKQDLQESMKKFEQTLGHLQKARTNEKSEHENNVSDMLISIEKKYQTQITELNEVNQTKLLELNEKLKKLEKENKNMQDKIMIEQHNKSTNQLFTEKKLNELMENEKKQQAEIERLKSERESKSMEVQKRLEKEKESMKTKINEIEEKYREGERKRSQLIFEQEKERAKWNLEKDHLISQRNELQESISKIEKRKELLLRENERLRSDSRISKRTPVQNVATSFNLNVSRNMGSEKKSPISSSRGGAQGQGGLTNFINRERSSYNDYSLVNNSMEIVKSQNSEEDLQNNKENSILGAILDSSRENDKAQQNTGFKTFYQMMQEKNQPEKDIVDELSPKKFQLN